MSDPTHSQSVVIYSPHPFSAIQPQRPCFLLRYPNSTAQDIFQNGLPEQSLIEWCQQFCTPSKTFIDIGAHCGMYSLQLARHCKRVLAFECQRETFYQLCGGIVLNGAWNVEAHQVALGDKNNTIVPAYVVSLDGGDTSVAPLPSKEQKETNGSQSGAPKNTIAIQQVLMRTLDSYQIDEPIAFLKIDAEHAEEMILRGAVDTLKRNKFPPILFESWPHESTHESLVKFLEHDLLYEIAPIRGYQHMFWASRKK